MKMPNNWQKGLQSKNMSGASGASISPTYIVTYHPTRSSTVHFTHGSSLHGFGMADQQEAQSPKICMQGTCCCTGCQKVKVGDVGDIFLSF